ncbi:MAG: excinuclease ABC subunit UvrC [Eubacteriales bacterium]|nr:excinuclease ABC subunit UvrC [Eubacteriales bacterium]
MSVNGKISELRKKSMALPLEPGVYIMKNGKGEIIYIGKAKKLKNRVSQYFGSQNNHAQKVRRMVANVDDFEYIITGSEFEALILECSLIKLHSPKYNILLKDDKGYSYIRISPDKWRKITCVLQKPDDDATYIGPYNSSYFVKQAVKEANSVFMLPTCKRKFPEDFGKGRPCLNFHIKQCCAPCRGRVKFSDYNERVENALEFLKGGSSQSLRKLTEEMNEAAENLDFERAASLRDSINAIKKLSDKQKVINSKVQNQDVIAYFTDNTKGCFEVFHFEGGRLCDRQEFLMDALSDTPDTRAEFILSYYSDSAKIPKNITLDSEVEDALLLEEYLSGQKGSRVYITVPQRGEQRQLADMCRQNAAERVAQQKGTTGKELSVLEELREILSLEKIPEYIESYDISNTGGCENVAGMVVFENGKPLKSAYRKFKIKGFEGQDDYASMNEVLRRRFEEYFAHRDEGKGFGRLPDLILLDGGVGQVNAVKPLLEEFGLEIPLFGMVKDNRHRTRAITGDKEEIAINSRQRVFNFVTSLQDEVHRFAIGYHRARRGKATLKSSLTDIEGVGVERAKALLRYFKTVKNIANAEFEELLSAPKMNRPTAIRVYKHFHPEWNEDKGAKE